MSGRTHFLNIAGDKKEWPVYMTFVNISSKICQRPSTHSVILFVLLRIAIKNRNSRHKLLDEPQQTNREVLHKLLRRVLQPLHFKHNARADTGYYTVLCPDGNFQHCKPVLAARLGYCPEHGDLYHHEWHVCFWCRCPKNKLGVYVPFNKQHPQQNHNVY
jgi:hypothetical protein